MPYEYFYNREAEQYIHYTMPKLLFQAEPLNNLSLNAKLLYSFLLDRAKSSYKNGFIDKDGKVYVYFPQKELIQLMNCSRTKMSSYMKELDELTGVGLIERKQNMGIGKNDRIYVKNFAKKTDEVVAEDRPPLSRFAYFHNMEQLRFDHYQIPKFLFVDEQVRQISNTAKVAYSIMLDRTKLSAKNNWEDDEGRIYIILPQKEMQELLGCSIRTIKSVFKELDIESGVGLICRKKQGFSNPDIIYVLDCTTSMKYGNTEVQNMNTEGQNLDIGVQNLNTEVQNMNIGVQNMNIEVQNLNSIYNDTDIKDTNSNDTYSSISINQSSANSENEIVEKIDGLIDEKAKHKKELSFMELLDTIQFPNYIHDFQNEDEFYDFYGNDCCDFSEMSDYFKECTIPYSLVQNPKELEKALKLAFGYNWYNSSAVNIGNSENEKQTLVNAVIKSLLFMLKKDFCFLNKQRVKYSQIIDVINELLHNSALMEWLEDFKHYWGKALSEYKPNNTEAYFRTCIWNSMSDYQFRSDLDSISGYYQAEYDIKTYFGGDITTEPKKDCVNDNITTESSQSDSEELTRKFANNSVDEVMPVCSEKEQEQLPEPTATEKTQSDTPKSEPISDKFIITFMLAAAIENNRTLKEYLAEDYQYPLPDGLTLNSPADLTEEKIEELEVKYDVGLRK